MMMSDGGNRANGHAAETAGAGAPGVDLGQVEALGGAVVHTMRTLRELLHSRALELEACRAALENYRDELQAEREQLSGQQRNLAEREQRCAEQSQQLASSARDLQVLQQELEARQQELAAAREALAAGEAELALADQAARARYADMEATWQSRMKEVALARESVAILQSQLEAALRKAAYRNTEIAPEGGPTEDQFTSGGEPFEGPAAPASVDTRESVELIHRLSRDARRRATGG